MSDTGIFSTIVVQRRVDNLILTAILILMSLAAGSQQLLYVKHPEKSPQLRIKPGMDITVIQYHDSSKISGLVGPITQEFIEINRFRINYDLIDEIHHRNQLVFLAGSALLYAGLFSLIIPPVNNTINSTPVWDRDYLIAGAILIPTGFVVRKISVKKYKRRKGYYWQYYDLE